MVQRNGGSNARRRVVLYCRVSTSDQDNNRQERDLREYAERAGFEIVGVFRETLSGIRKAKGKQPIERKKVMALAQDRRMDAVLVTELTRWGRSTQDLMDTLGQLASWDVSLIAQTGLTLFDLSTPQGEADRQPHGLPGRVRARLAAGAGEERYRGGEGEETELRQETGLQAIGEARPGGDPPGGVREALPEADSREARDLQDHGQRNTKALPSGDNRGGCELGAGFYRLVMEHQELFGL